MADEIEIIIEADGNVTVEGKGDLGPDCKKLTAAIEASLGTVISTTLKPEYRRPRSVLRTKTV